MSVLPSTFAAARAETRPLIVAEPMLRTPRPEMTPSSNETLAGAGTGGPSNEGGRASGPAMISRAMVPCGYSNMRSSTVPLASAFSTVKCAVLGPPFLPWLMDVGIHTPATWPYAPRSASVTCSRSEEHTSELQSHHDLVCRLLLEKKKKIQVTNHQSKLKKTETLT